MDNLKELCDSYINDNINVLNFGLFKKDKNRYFNIENIYILFLTTQDNYSLISIEDIDLIKDCCWCNSNGYCKNYKRERIHRLIAKRLFPNIDTNICEVDHIDQNKFNNTRENLRYVTHSDNMRNKIGRSDNYSTNIKGLYHQEKRRSYQCYRMINGEPFYKSFSYTRKRSQQEAYDLSINWLKSFDENNPIQSII
jgi:hypothetical protein